MERFLEKDCDPRQLSPLNLAFVGDGVFELFVRERLVCQANCPVNTLHKNCVAQVCCSAQAQAAQKLSPLLPRRRRPFFAGDETQKYLMSRKTPARPITMRPPRWKPYLDIYI